MVVKLIELHVSCNVIKCVSFLRIDMILVDFMVYYYIYHSFTLLNKDPSDKRVMLVRFRVRVRIILLSKMHFILNVSICVSKSLFTHHLLNNCLQSRENYPGVKRVLR